MFDWQSVLNAIEGGVIVIDEHLNIASWNDWMARASGLSASSVLGRNLFEVFDGLRTTRLKSATDDAFKFGSSSVLTHSLNTLFPLRNEVGQDLIHNVVVRPLFGERIAHCLLQITDVTISVARERVLRDRQNARYHAIVDTAPDAIITTSSDRRIRWFNAAAGKTFGLSTDGLVEQRLDMLLSDHENLGEIFAAHDMEGAVSGTAIQVHGTNRHGISAYFDVSFAAWNADDRRFITTMWHDVTERVTTEQALHIARESLRKTNEELEQRVIERTNERELALRQLHESQKMETIGQ